MDVRFTKDKKEESIRPGLKYTTDFICQWQSGVTSQSEWGPFIPVKISLKMTNDGNDAQTKNNVPIAMEHQRPEISVDDNPYFTGVGEFSRQKTDFFCQNNPEITLGSLGKKPISNPLSRFSRRLMKIGSGG